MKHEESNQEINEPTQVVEPINVDQQQAEGADLPFANMSFNRKFRKALLKQSGYTRMKNKLKFNDWFENIKNNVQNGKQLHASNTEENVKNMSAAMEKRNESLAAFLLEKGYSEERASEIIEKNMEIQERISRKKLKK